MRTISILWIISIILLATQGYEAYWKLPDQMVTHFNKSGNADGWSQKTSFYMTWYLMIFALNFILVLISLISKSIPMSLINVPNKAYWFANDDLKKICIKKIQGLLFIILILINVFYYILFEFIIRSNINTQKQISPIFLFAPVCIMLIVVFIYVIFGFRVPKPRSE